MKTHILFVWFVLALASVTVRSAELTWTGYISTDWNNPTNWTPEQVPTASDHVMIESGSVTIPADGTFAVMDWTGGTISGSLTVASNRVLNVGGSSGKYLYGPLTNAGSVVWSGSGMWFINYYPPLGQYGAIYNLSGALFDIQTGAAQLYASYASGNEVFKNAGTLRKSASGATSFYPRLINSGSVEVQLGTLFFSSDGIIDGPFHAASGTMVWFYGSYTNVTAPQLNGPGDYQFIGGTITLLSSDLIPNLQLMGGTLVVGPTFQGGTITNLTLNGTTLGGTNTVTGTATLGGGFSGALTVASNAVVNGLDGYSSGPLTVAGAATVNFTGGSISSGPVTVADGAIFNWIGGDIGDSGGFLTVMSTGVLNVGGNSVKRLYGPLTNAGSVVWSGSGTWFVSYFPSSGHFGAIYNLAGALFDIQNDAAQLYANNNEVFNNAGTLRKSASGYTSFYLHLINSGTVSAWRGVLSLLGGYLDGPSASLSISLGGPPSGTDYGRMSFSTPLSTAGNLSVSARNGYMPNPGDAFQVLTYPSSTNFFACISGLDLGGGILLQPQFTSTSLALLTVAYTVNSPLPELFISRTICGVLISWPPGFPGWTLQSSTNLSLGNWNSVANICNNQAVVPSSAPQQYFRLSQ